MSLFRRVLSGTRPGSITNNMGVLTEGASTALSFEASVQPLSSTDTNLLPEGRRELKALKLYTSFKLNASSSNSNVKADRITIDGEEYEVVSVQYWQNSIINHYKVLVTVVSV